VATAATDPIDLVQRAVVAEATVEIDLRGHPTRIVAKDLIVRAQRAVVVAEDTAETGPLAHPIKIEATDPMVPAQKAAVVAEATAVTGRLDHPTRIGATDPIDLALKVAVVEKAAEIVHHDLLTKIVVIVPIDPVPKAVAAVEGTAATDHRGPTRIVAIDLSVPIRIVETGPTVLAQKAAAVKVAEIVHLVLPLRIVETGRLGHLDQKAANLKAHLRQTSLVLSQSESQEPSHQSLSAKRVQPLIGPRRRSRATKAADDRHDIWPPSWVQSPNAEAFAFAVDAP
jgi:hypothetical protein